MSALDSIQTKYERQGKAVEIRGLDEHSSPIHDRLSGWLAVR